MNIAYLSSFKVRMASRCDSVFQKEEKCTLVVKSHIILSLNLPFLCCASFCNEVPGKVLAIQPICVNYKIYISS